VAGWAKGGVSPKPISFQPSWWFGSIRPKGLAYQDASWRFAINYVKCRSLERRARGNLTWWDVKERTNPA